MSDLFALSVGPWDLVLRGFIVYIVIVVLLRISGKRQMGQMGATEFVAILLISNAVQNSMNGGDNSLVGGIILAIVLIATSALISFLTYKSRFFSSVFEGTPTLLVQKGQLIPKNLASELMRESELKALLRKQGIRDVHEIETAILEADGTLSITRTSTALPEKK